MTTTTLTAKNKTNPWYREPWPWLLMAGPFIVIVAGIVTAWLAVSTSDGLVTDDYYKEGLAVAETLARSQRAEALVRLSQMLVDNPEIVACDVNPLFCDDQGVLAVDARMRIEPVSACDRRHFAVLPYPGHLEEPTILHDGQPVLIRPIRPEDEPPVPAAAPRGTDPRGPMPSDAITPSRTTSVARS